MSSMLAKAGMELVFKATGPAARRIADGIAKVGMGAGAGIVGVGLGAGFGVSNVGQGVGEAISSVGQGVGEAISSVGQGVGEGIVGLGEGVGDALRTGVVIAGVATALRVAVKFFGKYGFTKDCKKGSLTIVVMAKNTEATKQLFNDYYSGEVLKNLNKALRDAFSKKGEDVLTFDGLSLEETKTMRMTEAEYEAEERKAESHMNHLITEIKQQPVMQSITFSQERTTLEEEMTTGTDTRVKRKIVGEKYTVSGKSSTSSTQQQVLSPEVRAKVETTKPEVAATEASEQTTTESESSQQASSTSTEAETSSTVTDSYDIDVEQAKGFAIGTRSKVHARSSPQTTVGGSTREKKPSAKKRTSTPNREDKETPSKKRRSFKVRMGTAQGVAIGDDSTVDFEEST